VSDVVERLWRRMQFVVGRGRIKIGDDSGQVQKQQIQLSGTEIRDNTPRVGEYGFASMPLAGCHGIVLFVAGDRSNGVIIGTNDQIHRLKNLLPGEVAIYDDQGQSVYLTRAGIVVNGGGLPIKVTNTPSITLDSPLVHSTGAMTVDGLFTANNGITGYNTSGTATATLNLPVVANQPVTVQGTNVHTHVHSGVQVGSGNTGAPV
jgi:phage baseplate assembly protein V